MTTQADDMARLLTAIEADDLLPTEMLACRSWVADGRVRLILRALRLAKAVRQRLLMAVESENLLPTDSAGDDIIDRILQVLRDAKSRRALEGTMSAAGGFEVTIKPGTFTGPPEAAAEFARAIADALAGRKEER